MEMVYHNPPLPLSYLSCSSVACNKTLGIYWLLCSTHDDVLWPRLSTVVWMENRRTAMLFSMASSVSPVSIEGSSSTQSKLVQRALKEYRSDLPSSLHFCLPPLSLHPPFPSAHNVYVHIPQVVFLYYIASSTNVLLFNVYSFSLLRGQCVCSILTHFNMTHTGKEISKKDKHASFLRKNILYTQMSMFLFFKSIRMYSFVFFV